jgi:hypothetical protein
MRHAHQHFVRLFHNIARRDRFERRNKTHTAIFRLARCIVQGGNGGGGGGAGRGTATTAQGHYAFRRVVETAATGSTANRGGPTSQPGLIGPLVQ